MKTARAWLDVKLYRNRNEKTFELRLTKQPLSRKVKAVVGIPEGKFKYAEHGTKNHQYSWETMRHGGGGRSQKGRQGQTKVLGQYAMRNTQIVLFKVVMSHPDRGSSVFWPCCASLIVPCYLYSSHIKIPLPLGHFMFISALGLLGFLFPIGKFACLIPQFIQVSIQRALKKTFLAT